MPRISFPALMELQEVLERYKGVVEATGLKSNTKWTYVTHAEHFVRWLNDDFEPGINVRRSSGR
jgi:hypothetical protein